MPLRLPVAREGLVPYRSIPHSTRAGETMAWSAVDWAIAWVLRTMIAHAENSHKTEDAMLKEMAMLCKKAESSTPAASASPEALTTLSAQATGRNNTFMLLNTKATVVQRALQSAVFLSRGRRYTTQSCDPGNEDSCTGRVKKSTL